MSKKFLGFKKFCDVYKWKKAFVKMTRTHDGANKNENQDGRLCAEDANS